MLAEILTKLVRIVMNKTFLIILIILFNQLYSQSNNRFVYELKFVRDTISDKPLTNILFLDTNDKEIKFYYQELYELDSTQKATKNYASSMSLNTSLMLKRKANSFKNENFVFVDTDYFKYETTDKMIWTILPETKKQNNYDLQKATTNFGGRTWVAWFCKNIPINQGPFKFQGLPGLIFQIEDEKKHFSFNLIQIKKLENEYDTARIIDSNFGKNAIPISLEKYNKILLNSYNNPYSEIRTKLERGEDYTFAAYGRQIKSVKDLDEVRKVIQQEKRKYYNPIELDKAVKYGE